MDLVISRSYERLSTCSTGEFLGYIPAHAVGAAARRTVKVDETES